LHYLIFINSYPIVFTKFTCTHKYKSWRKNISWICEHNSISEKFLSQIILNFILYCAYQWIDFERSWKKIFICFIWVRHEEENEFQSFNVGKDLKWNILITKFQRFYHNIKVWWVGWGLANCMWLKRLEVQFQLLACQWEYVKMVYNPRFIELPTMT